MEYSNNLEHENFVPYSKVGRNNNATYIDHEHLPHYHYIGGRNSTQIHQIKRPRSRGD